MQYRNIDKQALKNNGYTVLAKISIVGTDTVFTEDDYIVDWDYEDYRYVPNTGFIGQFVERILDGNLQNISDGVILEDTEINLKLGIVNALDNNTTTWYDYGNFLVTKVEKTDTTGNYKFESADYTKKFNKVFDGDYKDTTYTKSFNEKIEDEETVTALWLAQYACKQAGVQLYTTNFTHADFVISSNQYDSEDTLRKVMQDIGKLAYSWVRVAEDNKVHIDFTPKSTNSVDQYDQLTTDEYYVSKKSDLAFGPVNKVLIGMSDVEGENLYITSQDYTPETECAIKIYDNNLTNTEELRALALQGAERLFGLTYTPVEINSVGHPWLDGDELIKLTNVDDEVVYTYPFNRKIHYAGYIEGVIGAEASSSQNSEYEYKSDIVSDVKRTTIIVNKQEQTITALAQNVGENTSDISQMQIDLNGINLRVQSVENTEVTGVTNEYAVNTSATNPPAESSSDWSETKPTRGTGEYIWARIKTTYKNGNIEYSDPVNTTGDKGETGATGPQGPQGEKGDTGEQGPQGEQGEKGEDAKPAVMYHNAVGTNIITEDAGELELKSINKLAGNTEQETTTQSANLFDEKYYYNDDIYTPGTYKYVKARFKGDRYLVFKAQLKEGKTAQSGVYIALSDSAGSPYVSGTKSVYAISNGTPYTRGYDFTGVDTLYINIYPNNADLSLIFDNYNLMVATSNVPYVPFVPDSPSPDYPQEIKNITGRQEVEIVGKNYFHDYTNDYTARGVSVIKGENSVILNGTFDQQANGDWCLTKSNSSTYTNNMALLKANTEYTISVEFVSGSMSATGVNCVLSSRKVSDKTFSWNYKVISLTQSGCTYTFTPTEDVYLGAIRIPVNRDKACIFDNLKIRIQLEKSSTKTEYEPYQGTSYSVNLGVENLFDKNNVVSVNGKILNDSGTEINDSTGGYTKMYIPVKPNTEYTISGLPSTGTKRIYYFNNSKTFISRTRGFSPTYTTITTPNNCYYLDIQYTTNGGNDFNIYQIEKGTKVNSYTPYGTTPIELCKIGDYQDYIYKDNGSWYLHKEIGKVVLNGSENWFNEGGQAPYTINLDVLRDNKSTTLMSNYFMGSYWNDAWTKYNSLVSCNSTSTTQPRIKFRFTDITSTDHWKTWLSTHNTIVYYVLATPTNTEITNDNYPELLSQLKALEKIVLNYGINNIDVIGELPIILDIDYWTYYKGETGNGIESVTDLYYVTNLETIPDKPTSPVTTSDIMAYNTWNLQCPAYTTLYKNFFTCSQILYTDGTYSWSDVTQNQGLAIANQNAYNAQVGVDTLNSELTNYVTQTSYNSDWTNRKDEIYSYVSQQYTTTSMFGQYQETMQTALSQKADATTISATATQVVNDAISGIQSTISDINETFTFDTNGLTIARGGNTMYLQLQNDRLSFRTDNTDAGERAYMTSNAFVLKELAQFQIGNFKFEVRTNGSLDFKKV